MSTEEPTICIKCEHCDAEDRSPNVCNDNALCTAHHNETAYDYVNGIPDRPWGALDPQSRVSSFGAGEFQFCQIVNAFGGCPKFSPVDTEPEVKP